MSLRMTASRETARTALAGVAADLVRLGFDAQLRDDGELHLPDADGRISLDGGQPARLLEQALAAIPLHFDALPLVIEGESKVVRAWTPHVVVERLKPTLYSFTHNRYGVVAGTDAVRARFSAEVFRRLALDAAAFDPPVRTAFLGLLEGPDGPLLVQRRVETCNLEVRVKRYHIGSPLHRYRYTERHPTARSGAPLVRWSRFDRPVVCFDWRHPLVGDDGERLADEPLPDDYAAVWMDDVAHAKEVARQAFCWLERLFASAGLLLVDLCFLIDRTGRILFGEISPDCMRIRLGLGDPERAAPLDKDVWRGGGGPEVLAERYQQVYDLVLTAPIEGGRDGTVHRGQQATQDVAGGSHRPPGVGAQGARHGEGVGRAGQRRRR